MQPTELARRLKLEPADRLLLVNSPDGARSLAGAGAGTADAVLLFAKTRAQLDGDFASSFALLKPGGALWVAYPKDGIADLSRNHGWGVLYAAGLTATEEIGLDEVWAAIRFQPAGQVKGSAIPGADMLPVGRRASLVFRLARLLAQPLFRLMFRFDVKGVDHVPDSAYVLIANHLGWMDAISLLLLFPAEPRIHYLADPTSMMRNRPLWALVRAAGGIVPVDRAQRGNPLLFRQARRCLDAGGVIAVFPEGDFGRHEGELLSFKKGFAHFAVEAGVPVVPVGLAGMKEVWLGKRLFVRVGEPIETTGKTTDEVLRLGEQGVAAVLPRYVEPTGPKPLRRWLTGLF